MKKVSLIIALFVATGIFAQKNHPKKNDFTAEQKTQLIIKKMSIALDLNEKQENKITPIIAEQVKEKEARHKDHKKADKRERKEISSDERFKIAMDHLNKEKALYNKMKNILSKEQYSDWKKMNKKHKKIAKKGMKKKSKKEKQAKNKREHSPK